ncbi:MAG: nucleotide sugar dehydrogenase, partial [bacterium]|nr:nucleotide sugar dehydrogenase [bacterium]
MLIDEATLGNCCSLQEFAPRVGVIGLGYVGLPVALGFAAHYPGTIGYDIHQGKIEALRQGTDPTREGLEPLIASSGLHCTADIADLRQCNFFVVAVPTPVDVNNNPDLTPLVLASRALGSVLRPGSIVVYESTVYPGVTEDVCGPVLEEVSGLVRGKDFFLGYSPERINPGDKEHTLERIVKVVSGENAEVLDIVSRTYGKVITAGVFPAANIKTAEAAKVIENTQRDLNIALMNELAIIFDLVGIRTTDVLEAAGTKWNFLPFRPGLVGGHCIGVDPFYLTTMSEKLGYYPRVIL